MRPGRLSSVVFFCYETRRANLSDEITCVNRLSLLQVALNSAGSSLTCDVTSVLWLGEGSIPKFSCTAVFPSQNQSRLDHLRCINLPLVKPAPAPLTSIVEWSGSSNFRRKRACANPMVTTRRVAHAVYQKLSPDQVLANVSLIPSLASNVVTSSQSPLDQTHMLLPFEDVHRE
jgi:hypothetical protein